MAKITFITLYFNRGNEVDVTMNSMLAASVENTSIIAVDDGSSDHTATKLVRFEANGVKVVSHLNKGFTRSLIDIIDSVDSEYIAICGSGDICHSKRLKRQMAVMEAMPDVAFCGTASRNIDAETGTVIDTQVYREGILHAQDFYESPPFTHGTVVFRNSAYKGAGGYDPRFIFSQDWDLWLRMLSIGKGYFINEFLYDRRVLADGASFSARKAEKQLLFKHAALYFNQNGQSKRDIILRGIMSHGVNALPDGIPAMRRDLSNRYLKLLLVDDTANANGIKEILNSTYGGISTRYRFVAFIIVTISLLGFSLSGIRNVARWVLSKYRIKRA